MHRDLLGTPLQQTLVLLWLTGLVQLASWLALRPISGTWVLSALLAGFLSVLVAGRLRRVEIFPVVAVAGLGGLLGMAQLAGISAPTLWSLTVVYGLLLWLGVLALLRLPLTRWLTAALDLSGGWGARGGRRSVETAIHWSCFALVLAGCCLPAVGRPLWTWGGIPTGSLATLTLALGFLLLAGMRYRLVLHAHLSAAIGVWLGLSVYDWLVAPAGQTGVSPLDPLAGLLLGLMALGGLGLARWMVPGGLAKAPSGTWLDASLFATPLTQWAMALASLSALQALALALPGWSGPTACAIAALTFLLGSRTLRYSILTLAGASLAVLTLTWSYTAAVHGTVPFGLRPGGSAGVDQWLVLILLTLAVAALGRFLVGDPERERRYARPLLILAWGLFGWSLAGALALLATATHGSAMLALVWLLAAGVLFPLLGPDPEVAYWRGAAVAVLTSLLATSLLGLATLVLVGPGAVLAWAYLLWIMGNLVLPRLDRQLGGWAVGGESWPWIGLLILGLAATLAGPEVLWQWAATLGAAGYLFLLSRNTRLPIAWAAVALCAWSGLSWTGFGGGSLGQWLVLGLVTLALSSLSRFLLRYPDWYGRLVLPLFALSWFLLGWTLLGGLILLSGAVAGSAGPALVFLLAAAALFPLLGPSTFGARWRGAAIALLASLVLVSLLGPVYLQQSGTSAALAWAYALWLVGNWILPLWNRRLPGWAVDGESWPWIGLAGLGLSIYLTGPAALLQGSVALGVAGYLWLLSRNAPLPLHWLAVPAFAWAGVIWSGLADLPVAAELSPHALATSAIKGLLWANLLLLLAPAWDRYGAAVTNRLGLPGQSLRAPLVASALALCLVWTFLIALWELPPALGWNAAMTGAAPSSASAIPAGLLLSLTYLNLLWQWRGRIAADLTSLGAALALLVIWAELQPISLAAVAALWCGLLAGISHLLRPRAHWLSTLAAASAGRWLAPSMVVAAALLFLPPAVPLGERLACFALLTGVAAHAGWQRLSRTWMVFAVGMSLVLVHGLWLLWVPVERVIALLPGYALQTALLTWLLVWLSARARRREVEPDLVAAPRLLTEVLASTTPWLATLAVLEWAGQGLLLLLHAAGEVPSLPGSDLPATLAYMATTSVLVGLCVHQARLSQRSTWVYAAAALAGSAGLYLRLLWFGLAPATPWDTAAIMASAYGLFLVGRLTLSRPAFHLMMALPLLALATVPYQLGSAHSALTLLAAGALYLLTRRTLHTKTPLYLGLLAINAAIYLWLPDWSERFGLFQVYLVPAALTVLLLLHLHRHELKRGVLHAARLGTLAALYAAATLDVFLVDSLWVFALALAVSLAGILLGISLRIRAFLYAGVVFLVLNVAGQLILLYPEHRLGKALLLMGLGTLITGAMIWFNLKRELFLQQIRVFRADLAQWE
jgi:hypothetical protein